MSSYAMTMGRLTHPLLAFALLLHCAESTVVIQDLSSQSIAWSVGNSNASINVPATVPGSVHLDLLAASVIHEPYSDLEVDLVHWVANESTWTYTASFTPSSQLLSQRRIELISEGIDTIAVISLNGATLWSSSDAFRRTVMVVSLPSGPSAISVAIASPLKTSAAAHKGCTGFCPNVASDGNGSFSGFNYIRKPAVHAGWDFAPPFSPSGIWRSLSLRAFNDTALDEVTVVTSPVALPVPIRGTAPWEATFTAYATAAADGVSVLVGATVAGGACTASNASAVLHAGADNLVSVTLRCDAAQAWWPAALLGGPPTVYNATITLQAVASGEVSSMTFEMGFRTTKLRNPPAPDGNGELFFFELNGAAIRANGANWVPNDAFPGRADLARAVEPKLHSFVAAGFNVLRVWGGGYPAANSFYEECNRVGLLVWNEFPFACAGYPTYKSYLADVAAETSDIVRRLQKYPILLYGGSNEVQSSENYKPGSVGAGNFSLLFFGAMHDTLVKIDTSRPFESSSPASFTENETNPVVSPPQSDTRGDEHIYMYGGDCWDPLNYPRARAVSEFGWQSLSSLPSMAEVMSPSGWNYWSKANSRRDTHPSQPPQTILFHNVGQNWLIPGVNGSSSTSGNARDNRLQGAALSIATAARAQNATSRAYTLRSDGTYALPTDALGIEGMFSSYGGPGLVDGTTFRDTLYLTQVAQAHCVTTEAEKYRRIMTECAPGGGGGCTMVSMYWMAADTWPAATKGGIEWSGRWKVLHYSAKRFYAPFLVSPWTRPVTALPPAQAPFGVYVSAFPPIAPSGIPTGTLRLSCWSWAAGHLGDADFAFSVPSWPTPAAYGANAAATTGSAVEVHSAANLAAAFVSCGCTGPIAECVMSVSAFNSSTPSDANFLGNNVVFPVALKKVNTMVDPGLAITEVTAVPGEPGAFTVEVTAVHLPAAAVWLESLLCCGYFNDNSFFMTTSPVTLKYTPLADARGWAHAAAPGAEKNVTAGQFAASLSVWSLWDTSKYSSA